MSAIEVSQLAPENGSLSKDPVTVLSDEEIGQPPEDGKTTYSKLSVTLMVIFSGLAIGSDGFNASIIGNLSLIFGIIYPDLSTSMYSRLSNAFIIGMIVGMLGFGYISEYVSRKHFPSYSRVFQEESFLRQPFQNSLA